MEAEGGPQVPQKTRSKRDCPPGGLWRHCPMDGGPQPAQPMQGQLPSHRSQKRPVGQFEIPGVFCLLSGFIRIIECILTRVG